MPSSSNLAASTARRLSLERSRVALFSSQLQGTCQRQFGLPVKALRAAMALDRSAEHVVIVDGDVGMLSLRTFSQSCTVSVILPEAHGASLDLPPTTPGPCEVSFATPLLLSLLSDLQPLAELGLEAYSNGLAVTGQGDDFRLFALLAGVEREAPEEAGN